MLTILTSSRLKTDFDEAVELTDYCLKSLEELMSCLIVASSRASIMIVAGRSALSCRISWMQPLTVSVLSCEPSSSAMFLRFTYSLATAPLIGTLVFELARCLSRALRVLTGCARSRLCRTP
jgi:hypothetical protein